MSLPLSILALVAAGIAIGVAWRSTRAAHRLALEMVHLRDRLAKAEAHYHDAVAAAERAVEAAAQGDPSIAPRIEALEVRLRSERAAPKTRPVAPVEADPHDVVRRHLLREGYTHVAVLDTDDAGRMLVEAERDGVTRKGRVTLRADGRLAWRSVSTLRAFP